MSITTGLNKVRRGIASFSLVMLIAGFFAINIAQAAQFTDVQPTDWFYTYVEQLATDGILNTSTATYRPGDLVNRAEMAKLAVEAFKLTLETPDTPTFSDVPKGAWFYSYVETAAKNGIVGGYKDTNGTLTGYYGPGDSVTREQAMKILSLAAPLTTNVKGGPHFGDVPVTAWSYDYVETGYNWSVVDGYPDGTFGPAKNINRAEIAKMVVNAMNPVVREGSAGYEISSVSALNGTAVEVCFSQAIDEVAAALKANYSIKDSSNSVLAVNAATVSTDGMCVELETATQTSSMVYTLLITGIQSANAEDLAKNEISFNGYSVNANGGDLTISADDTTPAGITLPGAVSGVPVFSFNVAAGTNDVTMTSIELHRGGTGVDASVTNVAIFDEANRVSKAKTFNASTDTATVSLLSGGLVVKAGTTKKLSVVATIGTALAAGNSEFSIEVVKAGAFASNAKAITGTFPVTGKTFRVGSTDGGIITWLDNGKPSDPKLGALQADVSKFRLRNESNDNDMVVNSLTIKETSGGVNADTEVENWALYADNVLVASTAKSSSKYITFKLGTPLTIKPSKTISWVVKADLIGGAGKTLQFALDNTLDLSATDSKFGYGAKVCYDSTTVGCGTATGTASAGITDYDEEIVIVQAGEVSIVSTDAASTDILKNKKNVIAGTLKVTTKAGLNLEIQKLGVTVTNNDPLLAPACVAGATIYSPFLACLIENVEIYDLKTGSVYDLAGLPGAAIKTFTYADTSVTIPLVAGETREFQVRFDTLNRSITGSQLSFALNNIGGTTSTSFYMVETGDNKAVTDVTPSSITFKQLNGVAAAATVNTITMSATKDVVVGSKGVDVLSFDITAGNASKLDLSEVKVGAKINTPSITTLAVTTAGANTNTLNIDAGNCIVTFTNAGVVDTDCADNAAVIDPLIDATPAQQAARLATLKHLARFEMSDPGVAGQFVMTGNGIVGNVTVAVGAPALQVVSPGGAFPVIGAPVNTQVGVARNVNATNAIVNTMYLWKVGTTNTLLSTKSGSLLAAGVVTFDGFNTEIPLNGTVRFLVTTDITDDQTQAKQNVQFYASSVKLVDFDNDDVLTGTVNGTPATPLTTGLAVPPVAAGAGNIISARILTLKGVGTLTLVVKTDDAAVNYDKNIVGGAVSDFVAAYQLTAQNEPIMVKDLSFVSGAGIQNVISEIILYKNDKTTEIARKAVTSITTTFTDLNYSVAMGSEKIYVKVNAQAIGKDQAGALASANYTFTANVTKADGASSGKSLLATGATAVSKNFLAHSVNISSIAFVPTATVSGATATVDAALKAGVNTLAIVAVSTSPSTNTTTDTGASIQAELKKFGFTIAGTANGSNAVEVIRLGGSGDNSAITAPVAGPAALVTTIGPGGGGAGMDAVNWQIANGGVAYYVIKATSTLGVTGYSQVKFTALTGALPPVGEITFNTDQIGTPTTLIGPRFASSTLDGPSLEYKS
jgi:hypothetical protein